MTRTGWNIRAHFDPFADKRDRIAHERGLEFKSMMKMKKQMIENHRPPAPPSKKPVTLPSIWKPK